jgi:hypothetical protein
MWRGVVVLLVASALVFALLTAWTNHTTAATAEHSHEFVQNAKSICQHAKLTPDGVEQAANEIAALHQPPNVHRAVARLSVHWDRVVTMARAGVDKSSDRYRSELKQIRLSAHLLNVTACRSVAPR